MGGDMKRGREGKRTCGTEEGAEEGGSLGVHVMYVQAVPHIKQKNNASALTRALSLSLLPSRSLLLPPLSLTLTPLSPFSTLPPLPRR
jgi:hypothetical protein